MHLNGNKHQKRLIQAVVIQSAGTDCFPCALCCSRFDTPTGLEVHVRSSPHSIRLKTRVLEDARCTGSLYSLNKSGIQVEAEPEGTLNLLQGDRRSIRLTVKNLSSAVQTLRGVWQLSNVPQVES